MILPQAQIESEALQAQTGTTTEFHNLDPLPRRSILTVGERQSEDICAILQRRNEITATLVQHQRSSSIPSRKIPVFNGDPLQYISFIGAFEQGVEENWIVLYYLEQFTTGQPRELVRSCQYMAAGQGYIQAKQMLKEHFGNEYKLATAYIEKA